MGLSDALVMTMSLFAAHVEVNFISCTILAFGKQFLQIYQQVFFISIIYVMYKLKNCVVNYLEVENSISSLKM